MLIVLEGLDGAGKSTQLAHVRAHFEGQGRTVRYLHFPRFDAPVYGSLIARFLRGDMGAVDAVDPYLVALLFAGDRADARDLLSSWLDAGDVVLLDRYVYSNVGYQCAKLPVEKDQDELRDWILDLEFGRNRLPQPDVSFFLDVPFVLTEARLKTPREGADRAYLQGGRDIHEDSLELQRRVREIYLRAAARDRRLKIIDCSDGADGMPSPEAVFERILKEL